MKLQIAFAGFIACIIASACAQEIVIDSISQKGTLTFGGARVGTTGTVEWASSLSDPARTNWHELGAVAISSNTMTTDIPMFFRIRGVPDTNLLNGLVAWYEFNGNAQDSSGFGNNGVVNGAQSTDDRFGATNAAYYFNGSSRITVPSSTSLNITNQLSIAAWVAPESFENFDAWVSKANSGNYRSQWRASFGNYPYQWGLTWWSSVVGTWRDRWITNTIPMGEWSHVVIAADPASGEIHLYRNGAETGSWSNQNIDFAPSTGPLYIAYQTDNGVYFHGKIDEVRMYNRTLSASEVQRLYLATKP